jgi:hypothetical protein
MRKTVTVGAGGTVVVEVADSTTTVDSVVVKNSVSVKMDETTAIEVSTEVTTDGSRVVVDVFFPQLGTLRQEQALESAAGS